MKKFLLIFSIISIVFIGFGAKYTASIYPYYLVLKEIKAPNDTIQVLIPEGKSPHTYSLTPSDVKNIYDSNLLVVNGLDAEIFLKNLDHSKINIFTAGEIVAHEALEKTEENENNNSEDTDGHSHSGLNPHVWTNPVFVYKYIIPELTKKMIEISPENRDEYLKNSKNLISKLENIDKNFKKNKLEGAVFTFHDSFHYYAQQYGIKIAGVVQSSPGKNPSPKELGDLISKAKENNVKVIFIEPQMSDKAAKIIANNLNIKIAIIDPLGNPNKIETIYDYYNNINDIFLNALNN